MYFESKHATKSLWVCILLGVCGSCSPSQETVLVDKSVSEPTASPSNNTRYLVDDYITLRFAVYCLPSSNVDAPKVLETLLKNQSAFQRVEKLDPSLPDTTIAARIESNVKTNYTPPDLSFLERFGRGVSSDQANQLQEAQVAILLDFGMPKESRWKGLREACEFSATVARQTGGLVWDEQTRELFSVDTWQEKRLNNWTEEVPNVSDHITIHVYRTGKYVRAITLGMSKFGLPDAVIDEFSWSLDANMGNLINLFIQEMAEGADIGANGKFDLDLNAIREASVREPQLATLKPNATATAMLLLKEGVWEEGDADNLRCLPFCGQSNSLSSGAGGGQSHASEEARCASAESSYLY